jgi:hypothetical protein
MTAGDSLSMNLGHLEAAVRAAADAYGESAFVIVGRASLAATLPNSPAELRATMDVDLFPFWREELAASWAAADVHIGRGSQFNAEHGFYVERVAEWSVSQLNPAWRDRCVRLALDDVEVLVLHHLDLTMSKLLANRQKDLWFVNRLISTGTSDKDTIRDFLIANAVDEEQKNLLLGRLEAAEAFVPDPDDLD